MENLSNQELIKALKSNKYYIEYTENYDDSLVQVDKEFQTIEYNKNTYTFRRDIESIVNRLVDSRGIYDFFYIDKIDDNTKTISIVLGARFEDYGNDYEDECESE